MKKILFSILGLSSLLFQAQNPIPNPGFENWAGGNPTGWTTTNVLTITPVSQNSVAHAGNSAAKLEVINSFSMAFPPMLMCNSVTINQNYQTVSFYYKASITGADGAYFTFILSENGNFLAAGADSLKAANNTNIYTQRTFSIEYTPPVTATADEMDIIILLSGPSGTPNIGSNILLDDLLISGGVTGLNEIADRDEVEIGQISPNPCSSFCLIPFSMKESGQVNIELCTLEGKLVKSILNEELGAGRYKAECLVDNLASGLYLCKLQVNGHIRVAKILVQ